MKCGLGTEPLILAMGLLQWAVIIGLIVWVVTR